MDTPRPLIRPAAPDDDAAVGELLVAAFVATYARKLPDVVVSERRRAVLRDVAGKRAVAHVFVAELDRRVVGTVAVWPPGAPGSEAWLDGAADLRHLAVDPDLQGRGVAPALLDAAEAQAWRAGATAICLHVRSTATGLARMYEGRGFRRTPTGDLDLRPEILLHAYVLPRPASAT